MPPAQDPFSRAVRDPWRPLRVFAPVMVVVGPLFLVAAAVLALSAGSAERVVVGSAEGARVVLGGDRVAGAPELRVYARTAGGDRPESGCDLETSGRARAFATLYGGDRWTAAGRELRQVARVTGGWQDGDVVTCRGAAAVVAVAGSGPAGRLVPAGLAAVVGAGATAMGVAGLRLRRARAVRTA